MMFIGNETIKKVSNEVKYKSLTIRDILKI